MAWIDGGLDIIDRRKTASAIRKAKPILIIGALLGVFFLILGVGSSAFAIGQVAESESENEFWPYMSSVDQKVQGKDYKAGDKIVPDPTRLSFWFTDDPNADVNFMFKLKARAIVDLYKTSKYEDTFSGSEKLLYKRVNDGHKGETGIGMFGVLIHTSDNLYDWKLRSIRYGVGYSHAPSILASEFYLREPNGDGFDNEHSFHYIGRNQDFRFTAMDGSKNNNPIFFHDDPELNTANGYRYSGIEDTYFIQPGASLREFESYRNSFYHDNIGHKSSSLEFGQSGKLDLKNYLYLSFFSMEARFSSQMEAVCTTAATGNPQISEGNLNYRVPDPRTVYTQSSAFTLQYDDDLRQYSIITEGPTSLQSLQDGGIKLSAVAAPMFGFDIGTVLSAVDSGIGLAEDFWKGATGAATSIQATLGISFSLAIHGTELVTEPDVWSSLALRSAAYNLREIAAWDIWPPGAAEYLTLLADLMGMVLEALANFVANIADSLPDLEDYVKLPGVIDYSLVKRMYPPIGAWYIKYWRGGTNDWPSYPWGFSTEFFIDCFFFGAVMKDLNLLKLENLLPWVLADKVGKLIFYFMKLLIDLAVFAGIAILIAFSLPVIFAGWPVVAKGGATLTMLGVINPAAAFANVSEGASRGKVRTLPSVVLIGYIVIGLIIIDILLGLHIIDWEGILDKVIP